MKKVGILGGGQLGKMLCLAAADWDLEIYVLDTEGCSTQAYCKHFVAGDFRNYDDVLNFGRQVDVLTIEIEHVNTAALRKLKKEGIAIHPDPQTLDTIKDKGLQKQFFQKYQIPTSPFFTFQYKEDLKKLGIEFPFVWKSCTGGYDGKGVAVIRQAEHFDVLPDVPFLIEDMVAIEKELAVIVARNPSGQIVAYPSVEMLFDPKANLLDYQICPAAISKAQEKQAQKLALRLAKKFKIVGLLAVEMFLTKTGEILVNEVAPRPHNSGHHTIEAAETSQFEQAFRAILDLPLGSTKIRQPSVLLNLVGAEGYAGEAIVSGFANALNTEGVHIHLYGKKTTKPFRKMGHVTIVNKHAEIAIEKALALKETLKIISL